MRVVVVVRNLTVSIVAKGGIGVLKIRGVRRVRSGKGVALKHCLFHVKLLIFASRHGFFILDLRLTTTHVSVSLSLSNEKVGCGEGNGLYMRELNMCVRRLKM